MASTNLEKFATKVAEVLGSSYSFLIACLIFGTWACFLRPAEIARDPRLFIVEFANLFMFTHLFIVQRNTNKITKALHIKLDEIVAALDGANNSVIKAEMHTESEIDEMHEAYRHIADEVDSENPTASIKTNLSSSSAPQASRRRQ